MNAKHDDTTSNCPCRACRLDGARVTEQIRRNPNDFEYPRQTINPARVKVTSRYFVTGIEPQQQAVCTCGWRSEPKDRLKDAQIQALLHESKILRRGYQHNTSVEEAR